MSEPLLVLAGPTASGKGKAAVWVAEALNAEIISMDSMKVYRGMDIGTAKPAPEARAQVPHHMLDVVEAWETYNVGQYAADANVAIEMVQGRGRRSLCVGGTPLYVRALLYGIFEAPAPDEALREKLRMRISQEGVRALHAELQRVDPVAAERLHPHDAKRITRALEVYYATGTPISEHQCQFDREHRRPAAVVALRRQSADLRQRIEARADAMFDRGWIDEVQRLLDGGGLSSTAEQAAGYREIVRFLGGEITRDEMIARVKTSIWRIARKQMSALRGMPGLTWLDVEPDEAEEVVGKRLYKTFATCHN